MISKVILRLFILSALKIHTFSYKVVGKFSPKIEPDGLHPKHRLMRYHDWFTERLQKDWNVLDIGCGNGALAYDIRSYCKSVTCIDIVANNIEKAKKKHAKNGIIYICADATQFDFKNRFHTIILSNVLEHIDDRVRFLKDIFENHKNSPPVLLLRVPMITRDWITLYKKEQGIEWRLDRTHFIEYTLDQIFDELSQASLKIEEYEIQFGEFYCVAVLNCESNTVLNLATQGSKI